MSMYVMISRKTKTVFYRLLVMETAQGQTCRNSFSFFQVELNAGICKVKVWDLLETVQIKVGKETSKVS